jgi:hypothetical protein
MKASFDDVVANLQFIIWRGHKGFERKSEVSLNEKSPDFHQGFLIMVQMLARPCD